MRLIIYLPEDSLNDATEHYVYLVKKAFTDKGFEILVSNNRNFEILSSDFIFVIRIKDFINIYWRSKSKNIIIWYQGLLAEEHAMRFKKTLLVQVKCYLFNILEKISLKKSLHAFYVSDFMKHYIDRKHSFKKENFTTIPCYNKKLNAKYFDKTLKKKTSFVYAGGLFSWQCFDKTVAIYKEIENKNSNAVFTVLTIEKEEAEKQLKNANIKNYNILYIPYKDLDEELSKHKYGFMLRENNTVNSCATPTKMNTYLAAGLIPIHTEAIPAFNTHLNLKSFEIKSDLNSTIEEIALKIVNHDNLSIDYFEYYKVCDDNFKGFYDDQFSIYKIKTELIEKVSSS